MRIEKSKTTLKKQLHVEISDRQAGLIDTADIYGSAVLGDSISCRGFSRGIHEHLLKVHIPERFKNILFT